MGEFQGPMLVVAAVSVVILGYIADVLKDIRSELRKMNETRSQQNAPNSGP